MAMSAVPSCRCCGAPVDHNGACVSERCETNRDTLRPPPSSATAQSGLYPRVVTGPFQLMRSEPMPLRFFVAGRVRSIGL